MAKKLTKIKPKDAPIEMDCHGIIFSDGLPVLDLLFPSEFAAERRMALTPWKDGETPVVRKLKIISVEE